MHSAHSYTFLNKPVSALFGKVVLEVRGGATVPFAPCMLTIRPWKHTSNAVDLWERIRISITITAMGIPIKHAGACETVVKQVVRVQIVYRRGERFDENVPIPGAVPPN